MEGETAGGSVCGRGSLVAGMEILGCSEPGVYGAFESSDSVGTLGPSDTTGIRGIRAGGGV